MDDFEDDDRSPTFAMDFSLYRIAKQLRLLGYDALCDRTLTHERVLQSAKVERRIFITASPKMLPQLTRLARAAAANHDVPRARATVGYDSDGESIYASSDDFDAAPRPIPYILVQTNVKFDAQFRVVAESAGLRWRPGHVFTRCVTCNVLISEVPEKAMVRDLVNPAVYDVYEHFYQCRQCLKVYWGMDNGVVVNYKALRTIEHLKRFCLPPSAERDVARHLLSLPRAVKVRIFAFLTPPELQTTGQAFPALSGLLSAIARGESTKFIPDSKKNKKRPDTV
jgi:uncharacterized protein with PIN domain